MKRTMRSSGHVDIPVLAAVTLALCMSASMQAQQQQLSNIPAPEQGVLNTFDDCTVVADNIVANCGFETGALTPEWTLSGDPLTNFVSTSFVHSGNFGMGMGTDPRVGAGCISQTLTTVPDQSYDLSYWVRAGYTPRLGVFWNGELIDSPNLQKEPYFQRVIPGLIGTGADTLMFCGSDMDYYAEIDDIVVIPSPATPR